jgi:hypothetical protein
MKSAASRVTAAGVSRSGGYSSTKGAVVQIRLSVADKAELLRAAEGVGLSLSAWIRMVLLTEARAGVHTGRRGPG